MKKTWDFVQGPPPEDIAEPTTEELISYLKRDLAYLQGVADALNLPKLYGRMSSIEQNIMRLAAKCK